jgi:hypothetical protein
VSFQCNPLFPKKKETPMKKYAGEVENPLMYGGSSNWDAQITKEFPRKCPKCRTVYPSDYQDAPKKAGDFCQWCQEETP